MGWGLRSCGQESHTQFIFHSFLWLSHVTQVSPPENPCPPVRCSLTHSLSFSLIHSTLHYVFHYPILSFSSNSPHSPSPPRHSSLQPFPTISLQDRLKSCALIPALSTSTPKSILTSRSRSSARPTDPITRPILSVVIYRL